MASKPTSLPEGSMQAASSPTVSPLPSPGIRYSRPHSPSPHGSRSDLHNTLLSNQARRPSFGSQSSRTSFLSAQVNDPTLVVPQRLPRKPSSDFAELHQELEQEQEAVVNRLLNMIRLQQQANHSSTSSVDGDAVSTAATVDSNSTAGQRDSRALSPSRLSTLSRDSSFRGESSFRARGSRSHSRTGSAGNHSLSASPIIIPHQGTPGASTDNIALPSPSFSSHGPVRDDADFFRIETQNLARENEMLKRRIRELERQVSRLKSGGTASETESVASSSVMVDRDDANTPVSAAVGDEGLDEKVEKLQL